MKKHQLCVEWSWAVRVGFGTESDCCICGFMHSGQPWLCSCSLTRSGERLLCSRDLMRSDWLWLSSHSLMHSDWLRLCSRGLTHSGWQWLCSRDLIGTSSTLAVSYVEVGFSSGIVDSCRRVDFSLEFDCCTYSPTFRLALALHSQSHAFMCPGSGVSGSLLISLSQIGRWNTQQGWCSVVVFCNCHTWFRSSVCHLLTLTDPSWPCLTLVDLNRPWLTLADSVRP